MIDGKFIFCLLGIKCKSHAMIRTKIICSIYYYISVAVQKNFSEKTTYSFSTFATRFPSRSHKNNSIWIWKKLSIAYISIVNSKVKNVTLFSITCLQWTTNRFKIYSSIFSYQRFKLFELESRFRSNFNSDDIC